MDSEVQNGLELEDQVSRADFLDRYRAAVEEAIRSGLDRLALSPGEVGQWVQGYRRRESWHESWRQVQPDVVEGLPEFFTTLSSNGMGVIHITVTFFGIAGGYSLHLPLEALRKTDPSFAAGYILGLLLMHRLGPGNPLPAS